MTLPPGGHTERMGPTEPVPTFEMGAERLLRLAATPSDQMAGTYYCTEWRPDATPHGEPYLAGLYTAVVSPTGARRQQLRPGEYGQAQYRLVVDACPEEAQYVWGAANGFMTAGGDRAELPITDADGRLYRPLSSDVVVDELLDHAAGPDEILQLIQLSQRYGIENGRLVHEAGRYAVGYLTRQLGELEPSVRLGQYQAASDFLTAAKGMGMNSEALHAIQSRLVSKLLGVIAVGTASTPRANDPSLRERATSLLVDSISDGTIEIRRGTTDRIFRHLDIYDRPEMLVLLHEYLSTNKIPARNHIFGVSREPFAYDLLAHILAALQLPRDVPIGDALYSFIAHSGRRNLQGLRAAAIELGTPQDTLQVRAANPLHRRRTEPGSTLAYRNEIRRVQRVASEGILRAYARADQADDTSSRHAGFDLAIVRDTIALIVPNIPAR